MSDAEVSELRRVEQSDGFKHGVGVKEGLPHSHVDNVVYFTVEGFFHSQELSCYLSRAEVSDVA